MLKREQLPPIALQLVGLIGIVGLGIFWGVSGRLSPTLLATAGSLVGAGSYVNALRALPKIGTKESGSDA